MSANSIAAAAALRVARDAMKAARFKNRSDDAAVTGTTAALAAFASAIVASPDTTGQATIAQAYQAKGLLAVSHVMRRRYFRQAAHALERAALAQDAIP